MATVIDALLERQREILEYLRAKGEISHALEFENNFKKLFVMACGSFFEAELLNYLETFARQNADPKLSALVINKALKRQYFTMFDWDEGRNVNKFCALFGSDFKDEVVAEIKGSDAHTRSMKDFLALGAQRNVLAHANLAAFAVEKTLDELREMYVNGLQFLRFVQSKFPLAVGQG
jgi:RiboL-PSP-HEPN